MATVLLVDDSAVDRKLLATVLAVRGHRTVEVADGAEALELARTERPDLVVSDILMPTMDGYELARHIRTDPLTRATPVVLWTANAIEPGLVRLAAACGVDRLLPKPSEPEVILRTVDEALRHPPPPVPPTPAEDFDRNHLQILTDALSRKVEELKAANEKLRRSEEGLRASEAQLRQAQRLESLGQLAGGIAHDFNNLLAIILSYATFVARDLEQGTATRDPGQTLADVGQIRRAAERAADLTRQLLVFSRREASQPRTFDLNELVGEVEELLRRTIGEHIELVTETTPEALLVTADPSQLEQVLLNLAVNARDAMPQGGSLRVETARAVLGDAGDAVAVPTLPPGDYVRLTVADTGSGMAPEVLDRAFEPFFTTKPVGEGTGLGLATAYGIVGEAGGDIRLTSRPGQGTVVTVHLPAGAEPAGPGAEPAPPEPGRGERVLVVEDSDAVREVVCRVLTAGGYGVRAASGPLEALAVVEQPDEPVDLVLTDVVMPEMSGPDLADRIRARRPGLPVVFMSGYPRDLAARPDDVVVVRKPFTEETLLRCVREALDPEQGSPPA